MKKLIRLLRYEWPLHFVLMLTNWLPDNVFFLRLRGGAARFFLQECGRNLRLGRNVTFHNPIKIHLGSDIFIAYGCMLMAADDIFIEDEVMFGPYCVVTSGNHTRSNGSFRFGPAVLKQVRIGKGAWISSHVIVTAGSKIGRGSLIAAGAVVIGEVLNDSVAGGIPAKLIKNLEVSE